MIDDDAPEDIHRQAVFQMLFREVIHKSICFSHKAMMPGRYLLKKSIRVSFVFVPVTPPPHSCTSNPSEICPIVPFERPVSEPELDEIPEVFLWLEKFPFQ